MGRPPTTVHLCRELHAFLLQEGFEPGVRIPRQQWSAFICQANGVGNIQADNFTKTGVALGLWATSPNQGRIPGSIVLLAGPNEVGTLQMHGFPTQLVPA